MQKIPILCVEDQREVLAALRKDLEGFLSHCSVLECESADEAKEVLDSLDCKGVQPGVLICDHVMPGENGIEFLIEVHRDRRFPNARKILLTGLATHEDTIRAINKAHIDHYIEKPWEKETLIQMVKELLTIFVLDSGKDYQDFLPVLDQETLYDRLREA